MKQGSGSSVGESIGLSRRRSRVLVPYAPLRKVLQVGLSMNRGGGCYGLLDYAALRTGNQVARAQQSLLDIAHGQRALAKAAESIVKGDL
jgi:hypothetical protein